MLVGFTRVADPPCCSDKRNKAPNNSALEPKVGFGSIDDDDDDDNVNEDVDHDEDNDKVDDEDDEDDDGSNDG